MKKIIFHIALFVPPRKGAPLQSASGFRRGGMESSVKHNERKRWKRICFSIILIIAMTPIPQQNVQASDIVLSISDVEKWVKDNSKGYEQDYRSLNQKKTELEVREESVKELEEKKRKKKFHLEEENETQVTLQDDLEIYNNLLKAETEYGLIQNQLEIVVDMEQINARQLYIQAYYAKRKVMLLEQKLQKIQNGEQKKKKLVLQGKIEKSEWITIQEQVHETEDELVEAKKEEKKDLTALSNLLGLDITSGYVLEDPMVGEAEYTPERKDQERLILRAIEKNTKYKEVFLLLEEEKARIDTTYTLLEEHYGNEVAFLTVYKAQIEAGETIDANAFRKEYEKMLSDVDQAYLQKDPYFFMTELLAYQEYSDKVIEITYDIHNEITDVFERYMTTKYTYMNEFNKNVDGSMNDNEVILKLQLDYLLALNELDQLSFGGVTILRENEAVSDKMEGEEETNGDASNKNTASQGIQVTKDWEYAFHDQIEQLNQMNQIPELKKLYQKLITIKEKAEKTEQDTKVIQSLDTFFATELQKSELEELDKKMEALELLCEIVKEKNYDRDQITVLDQAMKQVDQQKKKEIYAYLSETALPGLQKELTSKSIGTEQKDQTYSDLNQMLEQILEEVAKTYQTYSNVTRKSARNTFQKIEYSYEEKLIESAYRGDKTESITYVRKLKSLSHILENRIVNENQEVELIDQDLIQQIEMAFSESPASEKDELVFLIQAKLIRASDSEAKSFLLEMYGKIDDIENKWMKDGTVTDEGRAIDAYREWVEQKLLQYLDVEMTHSALGKWIGKKATWESRRQQAMDQNNLTEIKKYENEISRCDQKIREEERRLIGIISSGSGTKEETIVARILLERAGVSKRSMGFYDDLLDQSDAINEGE